MDAPRFDDLTALLGLGRSRRVALHGLAAALGLFAARLPIAGATRKHKKRLKFNAFGCVNVGGRCRGNDAVCCSGICQGTKPKKGKRDTSRCVAHNADVCRAGNRSPVCGGTNGVCVSSIGDPGECQTTTGNAGYCAASYINCFPCAKDADCRPICGADAACIRCDGECIEGTACVSNALAVCGPG
jgi:hypothetical protein